MDDSEGHVYLGDGDALLCFYLADERENAREAMRAMGIFSLPIFIGDWFDEIKTDNLLTAAWAP